MDINTSEVKIEIYKIGFLVSMLDILKLDKETVRELLQTYYDALEKGKLNGFTDSDITISDKPNLLNFLINQDIVEFNKQNNKCKQCTKKLGGNYGK